MHLAPDPNRNIADLERKLSGPLYQKLNSHHKWRDLLAGIQEVRYRLTPEEVAQVERAQQGYDGSAKALIQKLGSKGMTLKKLIHYLELLNMEMELEGLKPNEPLVVDGPLPAVLDVVEGDRISLTCNARGFPYPKFEWFKEKEPLGRDQPTLLILSAR
jgi:Xaa-Pro aminopeptidase